MKERIDDPPLGDPGDAQLHPGMFEVNRVALDGQELPVHRFEHAGNEFSVTISQGLAQFPDHGRTVEDLIAAADGALYAAKAAGRNCVRTAG